MHGPQNFEIILYIYIYIYIIILIFLKFSRQKEVVPQIFELFELVQ